MRGCTPHHVFVRQVSAAMAVTVLHVLGAMVLRHERPPNWIRADFAPSVLLLLPTITESFKLLPPLPPPVMVAPSPPQFTNPVVEIPDTPLDVMAITIPATDEVSALKGKSRELSPSLANDHEDRCPERDWATDWRGHSLHCFAER